jgi:hypothetical protein
MPFFYRYCLHNTFAFQWQDQRRPGGFKYKHFFALYAFSAMNRSSFPPTSKIFCFPSLASFPCCFEKDPKHPPWFPKLFFVVSNHSLNLNSGLGEGTNWWLWVWFHCCLRDNYLQPIVLTLCTGKLRICLCFITKALSTGLGEELSNLLS